MVHMTFGCNMHHGLGSANACVNQNAMSTCCSSVNVEHTADGGHAHDCHEHGDHDSELPELDSTFDSEKSSHGNNHQSCQDDGCNAVKLVKFVFVPLDLSTAYLGGAEDAAIACTASYPGTSANLFPDCNCLSPNVRSHLLLGIQLI